jgi:hydroxymethylpyrimidine pyrophosphatase-like HAD family hydrolase
MSQFHIQKILFLETPEGISSALRPHWAKAIEGRANVVQAQPDMLEIVPPATSKGSGVKILLNHLDISPDEVYALFFSTIYIVQMMVLTSNSICF